MARDAVRRLCRDLQEIERQRNPQLTVKPSEKSMLEWHFVLHHLPADTVYGGGVYHGKLLFPERYPLAPPSLVMLTPSGRLEVNKRLCLSMTDFHPESWNPAWTVESILVGLISFMIDERDPHSVGVVQETSAARRKLAANSTTFNGADAEFCALFPELLDEDLAEGHEQELPHHAHSPLVEGEGAQDALADVAGADVNEDVVPGSVVGSIAVAGERGAAGREFASAAEAVAPDAAAAEARGMPASAAGAVAEAAGAEAVATDWVSGEEVEECWICREDGRGEKIIQPCACRGSMSGVHASCVEAWIAHHRTNALNDEVPKCSVCKQPYCGTERRPGVVRFAQHLCSDITKQALRSAALVLLLVWYWMAAQEGLCEVWLRVCLFLVTGSAFMYKSLVLVASLPRDRLPPENFLRVLFTADPRKIAVHCAEIFAIVAFNGLWCAMGEMKYYYFLPMLGLILLPLCCNLWNAGPLRSCRFLVVIGAFLVSPFLIVVHMCRLVSHNPWRLVDPTDALIHVLVPLAMVPTAFCVDDAYLIVYTLIGHMVVLIACLVERLVLRKLRWKKGRVWWLFVQLAVLSTYCTNLIHNFTYDFLQNVRSQIIFASTMTWLGLCCSLSLLVNWELCANQYRAWQNRNGSFELSAAVSGAFGSAGRNHSTGGATTPDSPSPAAPGPAPDTIGAGGARPGAGAGLEPGIPGRCVGPADTGAWLNATEQQAEEV